MRWLLIILITATTSYADRYCGQTYNEDKYKVYGNFQNHTLHFQNKYGFAHVDEADIYDLRLESSNYNSYVRRSRKLKRKGQSLKFVAEECIGRASAYMRILYPGRRGFPNEYEFEEDYFLGYRPNNDWFGLSAPGSSTMMGVSELMSREPESGRTDAYKWFYIEFLTKKSELFHCSLNHERDYSQYLCRYGDWVQDYDHVRDFKNRLAQRLDWEPTLDYKAFEFGQAKIFLAQCQAFERFLIKEINKKFNFRLNQVGQYGFATCLEVN